MAIFSNKIVDVYYTDENLSNVTILYNYEKDGETLVGEYHLLVDEKEEQFQDLMKEVTYQDIELATLEMHKAYRNQLQALVDEEVKQVSAQQILSDHLKSTDEHYKAIFEYDPVKDADELFKCKMYLFTLDVIKNGSKTFRSKVRKAENILELCKLFDTEKRRVERKEAK